MRRLQILLAILVLSGCNFDPEPLFDLLDGREINLVVLSKNPLELSSQVTELVSTSQMKVVGQSTFVCLALLDDTTLMNADDTNRVFNNAMHGAKVRIEVLLKNGTRMSLREPLEAWRKYGRILERGEFSACATLSQCKERWPVGVLVDKIEISSEPNLSVKGVYWESQGAPLEKAPKTASSAATSEVAANKACSS